MGRFLEEEMFTARTVPVWDTNNTNYNLSLILLLFFIFIRIYFIKEIGMGTKGLDFKHKEVINITDGKRLGFVQDVTADLESGIITSIIVPGNSKLLNMFSSNNDIVIPWQNIKCIGDDVILVEI